jgi:DNA-binding CsgD family transcriptional regulator
MNQRASFHKTSVFTLSARELEVAKGLAANETVGQIALRLGINASAVSNYRRRAQEKLGLYNRYQLAAFARDQGW